MISNWCLTASDSAATTRKSPGLASFASVTSRWAVNMNISRMKANFSGKWRIHKTALRKCFLPESAIRHRHLRRAACDGTVAPEFSTPVRARATPLNSATPKRAVPASSRASVPAEQVLTSHRLVDPKEIREFDCPVICGQKFPVPMEIGVFAPCLLDDESSASRANNISSTNISLEFSLASQ